jgi:predicted transcriptional regulator
VLKDGFEYTEWLVNQVGAGLADLDDGRSVSWVELEVLLKSRWRARRSRSDCAAH